MRLNGFLKYTLGKEFTWVANGRSDGRSYQYSIGRDRPKSVLLTIVRNLNIFKVLFDYTFESRKLDISQKYVGSRNAVFTAY